MDATHADLRSANRGTPEPEPLLRGASVGRYVLLDQLGAGAMGVVYSAYDPELDRKLALKLLHPGASSREAKATRNRLRREAQALARLTHPNVVAVHDVGTHAGRVFVAMEFVAGKTLRQWVRANPLNPQPVDAVIKVFSAAGRGLAAAHRAGLVHRDFKPENVLIGDDGLVRVVDFGLARRSTEDELGEDSIDTSGTQTMGADGYESIASTASHSLDMSLTGTGRVMGTPAYMAPEQHLGEVATVRSDQFSFCVALWEALYGVRPFPGRDLPSLSLSVTTGNISDPPSEGPNAHHRVPAHVHRAILRGLNTDPDQRFTKIDDLLVALTHDPNRRRRRITRIVGINLLGAAGVFAAGMWVADSFGEPEAAPIICEPAQLLEGIWGPQQHGLVAERFAQIDAPFAEHSAREVERRLDAYTSQWIAAWGDTCESERNMGPSSVIELQRECLELRRRELEAFSAALISTSPEEFRQRAEHAVAAAESLPPISTCRDPSRLRADPHVNPEQRERVASLQTRLSEARTLGRLGDRPTGLVRAREVVEGARELDSQRMLIRALLVVAELEQQANEHDSAAAHLREAYTIAEQQGEDWLRAESATRLISLLGFHLQRPGEAAVWEQVSGSLLERIGDPQDLRGSWYYEVGTARMRQTELESAQEALDHALELFEAVYGHDSWEIERVLQRLGTVARERGDYERAVSYHTRLLTRREAAYGPDHPDVAVVHGSLGNDAYFRGDYLQARDHYEKALRIIAECYGEDSPAYTPKLSNYAAVLERLGELDEAEAIQRKLLALNIGRFGERDVRVTTSLENLGLVLMSANRFDEAAELFRRSLSIRVEHHGDQHVATATSKLNLGYTLYQQGDHGAARKLYAQTLATWKAKLGDDHPDLALVYGNLGDLDFDEGQLANAKENLQLAFDLTAAALGTDSADLGYYLTGLARVALSEGKVDEALELAERALDLREGTWLPPGDLGLTQLTLSRALIMRGQPSDRSRARDLALLARQDVRRGGDKKRLAEVLAWLEKLD